MATTRTKKKAPGFWDSYKDEGGGKYLTAPEKAALIDGETVLEISAVRYDEKNQYQGNPAPRFVVTFIVPEGLKNVVAGERLAGFTISDDGESSRDRLLGALQEYLESGDADPVLVVMERIGQFVALVKADA
jgi:hypothetical protein